MTAFCTFVLKGRRFAFPAISVEEVAKDLSVTYVPTTCTMVSGIANLRGSLVTVMDLCRMLGANNCECGGGSCRHLIIKDQESTYSFPICEIGDIIEIPEASMRVEVGALPEQIAPFAIGVHRVNDEMIILLDPEKILFIEELEGSNDG